MVWINRRNGKGERGENKCVYESWVPNLLEDLCNVVVAVDGAQLGFQDEAVELVEY